MAFYILFFFHLAFCLVKISELVIIFFFFFQRFLPLLRSPMHDTDEVTECASAHIHSQIQLQYNSFVYLHPSIVHMCIYKCIVCVCKCEQNCNWLARVICDVTHINANKHSGIFSVFELESGCSALLHGIFQLKHFRFCSMISLSPHYNNTNIHIFHFVPKKSIFWLLKMPSKIQ